MLNDETLQTNQNDILLLYPKVRISNFCLFALRVFLRFCNMKGHYNKISDNNESFEKKIYWALLIGYFYLKLCPILYFASGICSASFSKILQDYLTLSKLKQQKWLSW